MATLGGTPVAVIALRDSAAGGHADAAETLNRAQALGYSLGQPHRSSWSRASSPARDRRALPRCRIGVGGRCGERIEFPHSYWQAELALRIQKAVRGPERATLFDDLGVYQVLATARRVGHRALRDRVARPADEL